MTTSPIALRLPDDVLAWLDSLVARGDFGNRTEAIRTAIAEMRQRLEDAAIDSAIAEGYRRHPETDDELSLATTATRTLIEEEPW